MLRTKTGRLYLIGLGIGLLLLSVGVAIFTASPRSDQSIVLPDLAGARSIWVEDDWDGLDSLAPIEAHYGLERTDGQFTGKAYFSVASYEKPRVAVEDITIPAETVEAFLKMLTQSAVKDGQYAPRIGATDDYPFAKIQLQLETETVSFFSKSLGDGSRWETALVGGGRSPWGVTLKGKDYVIYSGRPGEALDTLQPYLKKDVLAELIHNEGVPPTAVPNATPNP